MDVTDSFESELEPILKEVGKQLKVYSSPLKRCRLLAERIGKDIILDDRLMEMNFGDWELKAWNDIPQKEIQPWYDDYLNVSASNGESLVDLITRVKSFLRELTSNEEGDSVVVVAHAGVIRVINGIINRVPSDEIFDLKLDYGQVVRIQID